LKKELKKLKNIQQIQKQAQKIQTLFDHDLISEKRNEIVPIFVQIRDAVMDEKQTLLKKE
jgi:hypothetical protein